MCQALVNLENIMVNNMCFALTKVIILVGKIHTGKSTVTIEY